MKPVRNREEWKRIAREMQIADATYTIDAGWIFFFSTFF